MQIDVYIDIQQWQKCMLDLQEMTQMRVKWKYICKVCSRTFWRLEKTVQNRCWTEGLIHRAVEIIYNAKSDYGYLTFLKTKRQTHFLIYSTIHLLAEPQDLTLLADQRAYEILKNISVVYDCLNVYAFVSNRCKNIGKIM